MLLEAGADFTLPDDIEGRSALGVAACMLQSRPEAAIKVTMSQMRPIHKIVMLFEQRAKSLGGTLQCPRDWSDFALMIFQKVSAEWKGQKKLEAMAVPWRTFMERWGVPSPSPAPGELLQPAASNSEEPIATPGLQRQATPMHSPNSSLDPDRQTSGSQARLEVFKQHFSGPAQPAEIDTSLWNGGRPHSESNLPSVLTGAKLFVSPQVDRELGTVARDVGVARGGDQADQPVHATRRAQGDAHEALPPGDGVPPASQPRQHFTAARLVCRTRPPLQVMSKPWLHFQVPLRWTTEGVYVERIAAPDHAVQVNGLPL